MSEAPVGLAQKAPCAAASVRASEVLPVFRHTDVLSACSSLGQKGRALADLGCGEGGVSEQVAQRMVTLRGPEAVGGRLSFGWR